MAVSSAYNASCVMGGAACRKYKVQKGLLIKPLLGEGQRGSLGGRGRCIKMNSKGASFQERFEYEKKIRR
jgi:hypothetical protein